MSLEQCQSILQQRRQLTGVSGKVRTLLLDSPGQFPSMEESANRLCVTSQTLCRQLATEGKTYGLDLF
ncbi:MAG: hypothetical protein MI864_11700 [Pseudomonadales bacterium]|nr:hypothetical protein [Pseudomonadales bacterium]